MFILPEDDLNLKTKICIAIYEFSLGINHIRRKISICAIDGSPSVSLFSMDHQTSLRGSQVLNLFLPQTVPLYGISREILLGVKACFRVRHSKLYLLGIFSKQTTFDALTYLFNVRAYKIYISLDQSPTTTNKTVKQI